MAAVANLSLTVGVRLKLLKCQKKPSNRSHRNTVFILLHLACRGETSRSESKAESENRREHQLILFVDDHLVSVTMFELECLFFFWSMKLFIRIIFFPFLCKYIYFDVK